MPFTLPPLFAHLTLPSLSWSLGRVPADCCYGSASWKDEEAWAAAWLYKATQQVPPLYLTHTESYGNPGECHPQSASGHPVGISSFRTDMACPDPSPLPSPLLPCAAPQRGYLTHAESVYGVCCTVEAGTNALQNFDWGTKNAGAVLLLYNITGTSTHTYTLAGKG